MSLLDDDYDSSDDRDDGRTRRDSSLERELEQYNNRHECDDNPGLIISPSLLVMAEYFHCVASEYNDGKGIKYVITFWPLLPPVKAGEKRRRNARAEKVKSTTYVHEGASIADVLEAAIIAVGRDSHSLKFKVVAKEIRTAAFSVKYSIPGRSPLKDMLLTSVDHYDELIEEATKKGKPDVLLEITESASRHRDLHNLFLMNHQSDNAAEDQVDDEQESQKKGKKRQVRGQK
jgi:hypothetical protein